MSTLGTILKDNWKWRGQIISLALFELRKQSRGAVLGWAWFFIRPAIYVACFWFALEIGLRGARTVPGDAPYILWLFVGIVPWFFMSDMLRHGIDVFHKYSYLVKKVKFPISAISSVYALSSFVLQLIMQIMVVIVYFVCGQPLDIHLVQVPFLLLVLYAFWWMFSVLMSPLCTISKDLKNLMGSLSTPLFWLSGVIYNVRDLPIEAFQILMYFNPITFFVTAFRDVYYMRIWLWEDPVLCITFAGVFVFTLIVTVIVYKRTCKGVADVL